MNSHDPSVRRTPSIPEGVALTAAAVAQERAVESAAPGALVRDPWARKLVDAAVAAAPDSHQQWRWLADGATPGSMVPAMSGFLALRTRWIDDAVLAAVTAGARQVVVLGAGFDTRALRLPWPGEVDVFTVDQPEVVAFVRHVLDGVASAPGVRWTSVAADLTESWPVALRESGFAPDVATVWIVEGLLMYFGPGEVEVLLSAVRQLSAPGSALFTDVADRRVFEVETFASGREVLGDNRSPVRSALDDPATWFAARGWNARLVDPRALAGAHGRVVPPVLDPAGPTFHFAEAVLR
ncbi:methyltransferase (TIGR00027 family) [Saccharopolyspora gloriosae]|uniref:S-adenosyl-L-methionine-dependent methyltransferase n=1 Tax=Saccharopolyspora gloriosae TaxID=455344 RepID=A0A840NI79_9PSEU|nr:methyltransferase (TIGR00027 family) [Saccharopolyspora gloriosae]